MAQAILAQENNYSSSFLVPWRNLYEPVKSSESATLCAWSMQVLTAVSLSLIVHGFAAVVKYTKRYTAVCLSGQPRNFGMALPHNESDWPVEVWQYFGRLPSHVQMRYWRLLKRRARQGAHLTAAETVQEFLYPALRAFDVFASVSYSSNSESPKIIDVCDAYRPDQSKYPYASLVCSALMDAPVLDALPGLNWWEHVAIKYMFLAAFDPFLYQLTGMKHCNNMIYEREETFGF